MSFIVGQTVGDYSILEELGRGGSGQVYKVEHTITRRREALKVLVAAQSNPADGWERFLREIRLQASLSHPNIAAVLTAFWVNDEIALVCELLDGESLKSTLQRGPLPLARALAIMDQALSALSYAHAHGVVHRDVSPANIFLTGASDRVKLIDFGLAKAAADLGLTQDGASIGTPHYMSPEQVRGSQSPDARSDVYSCGAVLFEMVTGRKLFEGDCTFEIMRSHAEQPPEHAKALNPNIPDALDAVISKAVAKEPSERFQSADSLRHALDEIRQSLANLVTAPRPARRPVLAWACGVLLIVGGLAGMGYWTARSQPAPTTKNSGVSETQSAPANDPPAKPSPVAPAPQKQSPPPATLTRPERAVVASAPVPSDPSQDTRAEPKSEEIAAGPQPTALEGAANKKSLSKVGGAIKRLNPFRRKPAQDALAVDLPAQSFISR